MRGAVPPVAVPPCGMSLSIQANTTAQTLIIFIQKARDPMKIPQMI
nr:hypothetical protein [Bartonella grahamii]